MYLQIFKKYRKQIENPTSLHPFIAECFSAWAEFWHSFPWTMCPPSVISFAEGNSENKIAQFLSGMSEKTFSNSKTDRFSCFNNCGITLTWIAFRAWDSAVTLTHETSCRGNYSSVCYLLWSLQGPFQAAARTLFSCQMFLQQPSLHGSHRLPRASSTFQPS